MTPAFSRHTLVVEVNVNEKNLISQLVELREKSREVGELASKVICSLEQDSQKEE